MEINYQLKEIARECAYAAEPDDVDYEVDDSVDALISYKNGVEDLALQLGGALDELRAFLYADPDKFPSGADTCETLARILTANARGPGRNANLPPETQDEKYKRMRREGVSEETARRHAYALSEAVVQTIG